jgi:hypothetical protein
MRRQRLLVPIQITEDAAEGVGHARIAGTVSSGDQDCSMRTRKVARSAQQHSVELKQLNIVRSNGQHRTNQRRRLPRSPPANSNSARRSIALA